MAADRSLRPQPDWVVPPGEILAEALQERGMTQAELARRAARPLKTINEIVRGKAAITPETALQFEYVLAIPARFWLNADREWQERRAREHIREELKNSSSWAARFPLRQLAEHDVIPKTQSLLEQTDALLRFFGVTSPDAWERQWTVTEANFRRPSAFKSERHALAAWLRLGEIFAARQRCQPFDAERLRAIVPLLRELTTQEPIAFEDRLHDALQSAGVALVLIPEFGATRVYGASYWLSPDKAVIQLSARGRKDDQFWFSLFHEIQHLLSDSRRASHLELEGRLGDPSEQTAPDEAQANEFARNALVPERIFSALTSEAQLDEKRIRATAKAAGVAVGIVVGRLQREGRLTWRQFARLKRTVAFHGARARR